MRPCLEVRGSVDLSVPCDRPCLEGTQVRGSVDLSVPCDRPCLEVQNAYLSFAFW